MVIKSLNKVNFICIRSTSLNQRINIYCKKKKKVLKDLYKANIKKIAQ